VTSLQSLGKYSFRAILQHPGAAQSFRCFRSLVPRLSTVAVFATDSHMCWGPRDRAPVASSVTMFKKDTLGEVLWNLGIKVGIEPSANLSTSISFSPSHFTP
jgi:hypothetical protein